MASLVIIAAGCGLLVLVGLGWFVPIGPDGYTIPQINELCIAGFFDSAWIALGGTMISEENWEQLVAQECETVAATTGGMIIGAITSVILLILGGVLKGPKKLPGSSSIEILKERYAKGEVSKEEFEEKKKELENS